MKAKITPKNIKGFVQGWTRSLFSFAVDPHILEQVEYRAIKAKKCVEAGSCLHCGCAMPEKLYEDRACSNEENPCYGPMLNQKQWELFKQHTNANTNTNNEGHSI